MKTFGQEGVRRKLVYQFAVDLSRNSNFEGHRVRVLAVILVRVQGHRLIWDVIRESTEHRQLQAVPLDSGLVRLAGRDSCFLLVSGVVGWFTPIHYFINIIEIRIMKYNIIMS